MGATKNIRCLRGALLHEIFENGGNAVSLFRPLRCRIYAGEKSYNLLLIPTKSSQITSHSPRENGKTLCLKPYTGKKVFDGGLVRVEGIDD